MHALLFEDNQQFWFETLRVLGHATYGGSDVGEATAERMAAEATRSEAAGHPVSARDAHLRAATYYRSAEFFLHDNPDDPRITYAYQRNVRHFRAAARLFRPAKASPTIGSGLWVRPDQPAAGITGGSVTRQPPCRRRFVDAS